MSGASIEDVWQVFNLGHFGGSLRMPRIVAARFEPAASVEDEMLGRYAQGTIYLSAELLTGEHPYVRPGEEFAEGRELLLMDVLLHEMIHQYFHENVPGLGPLVGHAHGFQEMANTIGARIGVDPVSSTEEAHSWPSRPLAFYLGALSDLAASLP